MGMKREKYLEKQVVTLQNHLADKVRQFNMIRAVASDDEDMVKKMLKLEGLYLEIKAEAIREFQKHHMAGLTSTNINDVDFDNFIENIKVDGDEPVLRV